MSPLNLTIQPLLSGRNSGIHFGGLASARRIKLLVAENFMSFCFLVFAWVCCLHSLLISTLSPLLIFAELAISTITEHGMSPYTYNSTSSDDSSVIYDSCDSYPLPRMSRHEPPVYEQPIRDDEIFE